MPLDIQAYSKFFFDRANVQSAIDKGTRRALSKFGAFVRQRSRTSIKKAPKADAVTGLVLRGRRRKGQEVRPAVSKPGNPPYSHTGLLKRGILFAFDPRARSVVIGPVPTGKATGAPEILEKGGAAIVGSGANRRLATYEPRPYMGPAYKAELPRAPQLFKDAIR